MTRPRTYDSREAFMSALSEAIVADGRTHVQLALATSVSHTTISRIVSGDTRWPRYTTIFPLIQTLGLKLSLERR
jgi:DNA-binding phage protein